MKRPELLGVLLKAIGFWSLAGGISGLPQAISFSRQYPDEQALLLMIAETFAGPGILIIASWFLIRATDWFVELACSKGDSTAVEHGSESSREVFGVVLIALGYWEILSGVVRLPYALAVAYRASWMSFDGIAYSGIVIVVGCLWVFATDRCVRFAYKRRAGVGDELTTKGGSV